MASLRRASWLTIFPLIAIAVFEGGVALWQAWSGVEVAGTYWNRNHLAGLLEMVLPLSVAYAMNARRRDAGAALPMLSIAIIFFGVVACASKLGYVATLAGLLTMGLVVALTRLTGVARWVCLAALPVLGIAAFTFLGNQDVLVRISGVFDTVEGMTGEGRTLIWADSLRLLSAYPMFGSGLGTYSTAFLGFQNAGLGLHWTHAHNDYLELATNLGVVGLALFGALIVLIARRAIQLVRTRRQSGSDLLALGCVGSFAAIGLHSIGDFNLYLPANALVLAWIAGIAAGIPPYVARAGLQAREDRGLENQAALRFPAAVRVFAAGLSIVALAMASIAIARGSASQEVEASSAPLTLEDRLDNVRKRPAWPYAWLDLAEGLMASGRTGEAKASVANAIALGPRVRPVVRRSATLFDALGDRRQAVTLMSRELHETGADAGALFDWFVERRIPSADVLAGLSNDARALPAYLRYLMLPGTCPDAERAWHALLAHHPEPRLAGDYVNFVRNECYRPDDADRAWTEYAKLASPGYQVSDWVFNGDFERDPAPVQFDWQWRGRSRGAEAALDNSQKFSGARSLRLVFRGPSRTPYEGASQDVAVTPGVYRFTAAVRTLDLRSADGIFFHIDNISRGPSIDIRTEETTGTAEWRTISADVVVPEGVTQVRIQVVRRPGPGAEKEEDLNGTAWVDAITLSKIG